MQLFLPGLITIIVAGVFIFFVIPRVSPILIFIISLIFLFIMIQSHYSMFANEYKLTSWREQLSVFASPILISIIVIGLVFAASELFNFDIKSLLDSYSKISSSK
jgi:hypothetical protein